MNNEPSIERIVGGFIMLVFVAGMAWLGWTYLEIGSTFFGWLPQVWLKVTFMQFCGLILVIQTGKWLLRGLRLAIIGR